jgi:hypothetical protein
MAPRKVLGGKGRVENCAKADPDSAVRPMASASRGACDFEMQRFMVCIQRLE